MWATRFLRIRCEDVTFGCSRLQNVIKVTPFYFTLTRPTYFPDPHHFVFISYERDYNLKKKKTGGLESTCTCTSFRTQGLAGSGNLTKARKTKRVHTGRTEAINGDAQKAERDEAHEDDPS